MRNTSSGGVAAHRKNPRSSITISAIPILVLSLVLLVPMNAACQQAHGSPDAGIEELRALATGSSSAEALARFESRHPRTRAAGLARLLRGYLAYSIKDYQAAIDALDSKLIDETTSLGDYALFFRAESETAAGANEDAWRDYQALIEKDPESLKRREAIIRSGEAALALGKPDDAMRAVETLVAADDSDALLISAEALEASGRKPEAIKLYRRIYYELPATKASADAESKLEALGASPKASPGPYDQELSRCERLFAAKEYFGAAAAFGNLLTAFPDRTRNDRIALHYGLSLLNNRQPAQAAIQLGSVSEQDPKLHAQALDGLGEALRRSNRLPQSAGVVDRLLKSYPNSSWAEDALHDLAVAFGRAGSDAESASRYRQLLSLYPKSSFAPEASYNLGLQAYRQKQYADAARILEQHLAKYRYPETRFLGEAGFWAGKAEERTGNLRRALALYDLVMRRYPYGYDGYVASLRAKRIRTSDPSLKPEPTKPGSDLERIESNITYVQPIEESVGDDASRRFARAEDLEVIGLYDFAVRELNAVLETAPTSPRVNLRLARLYARRGDNFQATLILRRAYPDIYSYRDEDLPRDAWEIFFPLTNWETIKQEAKRYGLDPYTAAGLIRQESVFNPNAISRAGARGLMQLMPATGQLISKRQGNGTITAQDLLNPTLNIKLGMNYLAQMMGQFGRIEYAAAAYNAGPARAARWIAERGTLDIEDWIETIPFSETRGYVQGVVRYSANYRRFHKE